VQRFSSVVCIGFSMERDRNESGQYADGIDPETVLDVVDAREDLGRPVTAGDVVDELGIARRTAHNKLGALVERGVLETRKIGARGRVWWRPIPADSVDTQPPRDARHSPETPAGDEREPRGRVLEGSMTLSNDEFAALGLGLGVGTGATLMSPALGLGMGVGIVATVLYATQQKRNGEPEDDDCVDLFVPIPFTDEAGEVSQEAMLDD